MPENTLQNVTHLLVHVPLTYALTYYYLYELIKLPGVSPKCSIAPVAYSNESYAVFLNQAWRTLIIIAITVALCNEFKS